MIERDIERKLREGVREIGGMCLKWVSPGYTGVPDRIILMPGGVIAFAETKAPGKKERPRQAFVQAALRAMGFTVFSSVDSPEKVHDVVHWCKCKEAERKCSISHTAINDM